LGGQKNQANITKLELEKMIESVHAPNCKFYLLCVNGKAKKVVLLLNGTQYARPT